jgi:molybdopterin converting factor subunit 1
MIVKVSLFASAKEQTGTDTLELTLDDSAVLGDLKRALIEQYPAITRIVAVSTFSVDKEYSSDGRRLYHGCEVACIPPVSGG